MDSSVKSLKQPKNGQSPGGIKNVSTCAKASKTGITKNTKKTKEEVLDTTIQALIRWLFYQVFKTQQKISKKQTVFRKIEFVLDSIHCVAQIYIKKYIFNNCSFNSYD